MTPFKLTRRASNRSGTTFHVIDSAGAICGSINVANDQAADLVRCWSGATTDSPQRSSSSKTAAATLSARPRSSAFADNLEGLATARPIDQRLRTAQRQESLKRPIEMSNSDCPGGFVIE